MGGGSKNWYFGDFGSVLWIIVISEFQIESVGNISLDSIFQGLNDPSSRIILIGVDWVVDGRQGGIRDNREE